jgi:hypothetical protein
MRQGVPGHHAGSDVPGDIAATAETAAGLVKIFAVDVGVTGHALQRPQPTLVDAGYNSRIPAVSFSI